MHSLAGADMARQAQDLIQQYDRRVIPIFDEVYQAARAPSPARQGTGNAEHSCALTSGRPPFLKVASATALSEPLVRKPPSGLLDLRQLIQAQKILHSFSNLLSADC